MTISKYFISWRSRMVIFLLSLPKISLCSFITLFWNNNVAYLSRKNYFQTYLNFLVRCEIVYSKVNSRSGRIMSLFLKVKILLNKIWKPLRIRIPNYIFGIKIVIKVRWKRKEVGLDEFNDVAILEYHIIVIVVKHIRSHFNLLTVRPSISLIHPQTLLQSSSNISHKILHYILRLLRSFFLHDLRVTSR